jgi:hypothetical protein
MYLSLAANSYFYTSCARNQKPDFYAVLPEHRRVRAVYEFIALRISHDAVEITLTLSGRVSNLQSRIIRAAYSKLDA